MQLTSDQHAVLAAASATELRPLEAVAGEAGVDPDRAAGAAFALEEAGLVELEERSRIEYELTEEAESYLEAGLPEHRLHRAAVEAGATEGPVPIGAVLDAADLADETVEIALSNFARKGLGTIEDGRLRVPEPDPGADPEAEALEAIASGDAPAEAVVGDLERRDLVVGRESVDRAIRLTDAGVDALMGGAEVADAEGAVRPEHLLGGTWRGVEYAPYNVEAAAAPVNGGKRHVLRQVADRVKEVLVGMGFREMTGPHIDADFWIHDCLFMPQDHPARTHWDRFALDVPPMDPADLPEGLVDRVAAAHREGVGPDGEGYHSPWSESFARAVALRGHTTSLSMRYLSGTAVGDLEPPQRYFSVEKVYRNDTLDPTHLLEF
ncbi:MAG: phenylalanine--tRNA ligase subunit alpha, partial [Halobacteriota archaeon]